MSSNTANTANTDATDGIDSEDDWQAVTPGHQVQTPDPKMSLRVTRTGYFNARADSQYLSGVEAVRVYTAASRGLIAIEPADDDDPRSFTLHRESDSGASFSLASACNQLGIDEDGIDEARQFDIEERGDRLVVDVSPLLGGLEDGDDGSETTDDVEPDQSGARDTLEGETEWDEAPPKSIAADSGIDVDDDEERQLLIDYLTGATGEEGSLLLRATDIGEVLGLTTSKVGYELRYLRDSQPYDLPFTINYVDRSEWMTGAWRLRRDDTEDEEQALEEIVAEVDTVSELGEAIDVSPDRARTLAMDAGVYSDLEDHPEEGGYGRRGAR